MNPKSFPKRLDSKTSCLRITVPENLDLALEGLIRKVLREQPKTDDIYAFAANYFETLLRIRDKAGVEYTSTQLCPFHNDEETREMIVLAGTFPRHAPGRVQGKGSGPLKTETKKETEETDSEKGVKRYKETLKNSNPEPEKKQATPDLIKKLPLLVQNQGLIGEEVVGEKTTDKGPDRETTETVKEEGDEEENLTSDPIKEFVEKELLMEGNSKDKVAEGEVHESSGGAREGKNKESEGGALLVSNADEKKDADGRDDPGAKDIVGGEVHVDDDGGKRKIDPEIRETDEKGVEERDAAKDEMGNTAQSEAEGKQPLQETQQKKEKENEEESGKLRAEEESQNKMESEGVEAPLPPLPPSPGAAEKHAQELVHEISPSNSMEADVSPEQEGGKITQSPAFSEEVSPQEKIISEIGGVQQPAEDRSETDAQPSTASPMKTDEESPETSHVTNSYDSKPVENDDARATETDKRLDRKEAINSATESIARGEGKDQDLTTEAASGRTELSKNNSGTGSSPELVKDVQEAKEGLHQTKGGESNTERENQDPETDDPNKPDLISTEEGAKVTSSSAVEEEHAAGQPRTGAEDSTAEPGEEKGTELPGKLDSDQKAGGSEVLKQEHFPHSHVKDFDGETELKRRDEEGKADEDKILSNEEVEAKEQSLTEGRESLGNQTSRELPLQKASTAEAPTEESTDSDVRPTEVPKVEEQEDVKQEAPRDSSSPMDYVGRLKEPGEPEIATYETESAKPQEFKTEGTSTAENEAASLTNEELCSVVDINHLKRDGGNQEEPQLAKPRPENTAEEKSAPEPEGSLSPSAPNEETCRENQNDKQEFEAEGATQGKGESEEPPNAKVVHEPVKSETDKDKGDSAEGTPPETREGFDLSAEGKQIIIVEEPETTKENPEESCPSGEIQIKTIQTHYYDTLRVPETLTREYRVHEMIAPTVDGLQGGASPPPSTRDEGQESPGYEERSKGLTDDNAVPPTPKNSPTSDGDVSSYAEAAEAQSHVGPPYHPSDVRADALLAVDGLDRDAQVSDSDDLLHLTTPTSDVASSIAELSLQEASETFLTNEKRFSSLEKEEIRFVTPTTEEVRKDEPEGQVIESGREIDEALPSTGGALPAPQGEDESVPDAPPSAIKPEYAEDVQRRTVAGVESAEKEGFHLLQKTEGRNVPESCPEEVQVGSGPTGGEASCAETDSATSSATTDLKRADSARRDFGQSSARSLDLGKRNPLLRTRSLSTHRHGVADFEVWSTIEKELEEAATKIQSKFRGYKTRKKLRREVAVQISTEESSKRSTPVEADDADSPRATGEFHDGIVLAEHPR